MEKILQDACIGQNLRRLRKDCGLSQTALVAQLQVLNSHISRTTYNKIEKGIRNIYVSDLIRLKRIYNVSFDEFFRGIEIL